MIPSNNVIQSNIIPPFDERGLLPEGSTGFYFPSLEEFIDRFVTVVNIERRTNLFEKYINFCMKCLNTNALVSHYVNGSYTTIKEEPGDIDLLIMLDGLTVIDDSMVDEFKDIGDWQKMKELYSCHTFVALDLPEDHALYEHHNSVKNDVISWWKRNYLDEQRTEIDSVPKGVIILSEDEIKKVRSL